VIRVTEPCYFGLGVIIGVRTDHFSPFLLCALSGYSMPSSEKGSTNLGVERTG
jgi:hypothetical protein